MLFKAVQDERITNYVVGAVIATHTYKSTSILTIMERSIPAEEILASQTQVITDIFTNEFLCQEIKQERLNTATIEHHLSYESAQEEAHKKAVMAKTMHQSNQLVARYEAPIFEMDGLDIVKVYFKAEVYGIDELSSATQTQLTSSWCNLI